MSYEGQQFSLLSQLHALNLHNAAGGLGSSQSSLSPAAPPKPSAADVQAFLSANLDVASEIGSLTLGIRLDKFKLPKNIPRTEKEQEWAAAWAAIFSGMSDEQYLHYVFELHLGQKEFPEGLPVSTLTKEQQAISAILAKNHRRLFDPHARDTPAAYNLKSQLPFKKNQVRTLNKAEIYLYVAACYLGQQKFYFGELSPEQQYYAIEMLQIILSARAIKKPEEAKQKRVAPKVSTKNMRHESHDRRNDSAPPPAHFHHSSPHMTTATPAPYAYPSPPPSMRFPTKASPSRAPVQPQPSAHPMHHPAAPIYYHTPQARGFFPPAPPQNMHAAGVYSQPVFVRYPVAPTYFFTLPPGYQYRPTSLSQPPSGYPHGAAVYVHPSPYQTPPPPSTGGGGGIPQNGPY